MIESTHFILVSGYNIIGGGGGMYFSFCKNTRDVPRYFSPFQYTSTNGAPIEYLQVNRLMDLYRSKTIGVTTVAA